MEERHNVYRDGKVHVLSEECATRIFKPHERPVDGARDSLLQAAERMGIIKEVPPPVD